MPLTVVNTRDLHSRGQQHQEGKRDKLITNLIVDSVERDSIAVGKSDFDQDGLNELASKTLPDILAAATQGPTPPIETPADPPPISACRELTSLSWVSCCRC